MHVTDLSRFGVADADAVLGRHELGSGHSLMLASPILLSAIALLLTVVVTDRISFSMQSTARCTAPWRPALLSPATESLHHLQAQARRCRALQLDRSAALQMMVSSEQSTKYA